MWPTIFAPFLLNLFSTEELVDCVRDWEIVGVTYLFIHVDFTSDVESIILSEDVILS